MKSTILAISLNFSLIALAALPQKWDVDLGAQPPHVFTLQRPRGETYELEAVLKDHGKPFAQAITNAFIYWQTNGMENLYWSAPASVSNNVLRAQWLPSMDPGAATVRGYIGDPGHIYAAAFQFRFIASPGATPNELPLPQKVIDFAKVTVLNPPWSGGGSGVDTNAVRDIVRKTVDGAAKMLPKYLWCMDFDDSYPDDAAWYYAQPQDYGSCSAVRYGGSLFRNYDWRFDGMAEFVVRMSAGPGRFASVGVANCGTNLTEEIVTSGKPSRYFKCLPGRTVDGINENGVVAEINVVGGDPDWHTEPTPTPVHPLAAVRWALDNATNAEHAAKFLAANIRFPQGWEQNFHYMVADELGTWIVENGVANGHGTARAVMTNFIVDPPGEGEGYERYDLLFGDANITNAWFTRAYRRETNPPWVSDLKDVIDFTNEIFNAWASNPKEHFRNQTIGGQSWWQTVHTSVYALTNRTLRICVQETPDWYTFTVPAASSPRGVDENAVREIVELMVGTATNGIPERLAALQSEKLDKSGGTMTGPLVINDDSDPIPFAVGEEGGARLNVVFDRSEAYLPKIHVELTGDRPHLDDYDEHAVDLVIGDNQQIAPVVHVRKDINDLKAVKADEFTEWVYDKPNVEIEYLQNLGWHPKVGGLFNGDENSLELHWSSDQSYYNIDFTATRKRVLRTGDAATPQELTAAISTNNPAFVSAVRNTPAPEPGQGEDPPWGEYGTVGAVIAGLVAGLKWLKNKVFDSAGNIQDQFATDLLGKQVAINALHYALYTVPTSGADANKLKDRAVNAFTFAGSLPTFPAQVAGYARDFLLNVTATADGSNITIPEPDGSTATSIGDALAFTAGKTYIVAITEIAAKHYYFRVIDTTPANAA